MNMWLDDIHNKCFTCIHLYITFKNITRNSKKYTFKHTTFGLVEARIISSLLNFHGTGMVGEVSRYCVEAFRKAMCFTGIIGNRKENCTNIIVYVFVLFSLKNSNQN